MSYKNTRKKLPDIARELSVQWVLEGSVLRQASQVRITVNLIDARTDHTVWTHVYLRDISNLLQLQGEVAEAIAEQIQVEITPQTKKSFAQSRPVNKEAQDLYLQGLLCFNTDQFTEAVDLFQKAIAADPNFAQPHAALARTYGRLGEGGQLPYEVAFSRQQAEANRAIQLDDSLAEGHAELANAVMDLNWDWATAGRELRRALELNPGSVPIRSRYAIYLLRAGNSAAAIAEIERCMKLDPLSEQVYRDAEPVYFFSRKYDETLALLTRTSHQSRFHFFKGAAYTEKRMYEKAIAEFQQGRGPHMQGHLGNVYARAGQANAANKVIEQLKVQVKRDGLGRYEIALIYAGLGNKDEAFAWLASALEQHDQGLTNLKIDPSLDPLRSDPRFNNLLKQVGFLN